MSDQQHIPDALRTYEANTVLESLRDARTSLDDYTFDFGSWTQCTCGHIYIGAMGRPAHSDGKVRYETANVYQDSLRAVMSAWFESENIERNDFDLLMLDSEALTGFVSDVTRHLAKRTVDPVTGDADELGAAVTLLDNAIDYVEAREENAMRELICV